MVKKAEKIKREDGSSSERGLWDNIRDNKGSGKKPSKEMKEQAKKITQKEKRKKKAESDSHMALSQLDNLAEKAHSLSSMIHPGDDLEDWIDAKIARALSDLEDLENYVEYHRNEKGPMIPEVIEDEDGSEWHYKDSSFEEDDGMGDRFFYMGDQDYLMASVVYRATKIAKKKPKGKKWKHTYKSKSGKKRTVWHGDSSEKTSPGTSRGDSYCARSYGIMKDHGKDCGGKDRNTPNCLSRKRWRCKGKKSSRSSKQK